MSNNYVITSTIDEEIFTETLHFARCAWVAFYKMARWGEHVALSFNNQCLVSNHKTVCYCHDNNQINYLRDADPSHLSDRTRKRLKLFKKLTGKDALDMYEISFDVYNWIFLSEIYDC